MKSVIHYLFRMKQKPGLFILTVSIVMITSCSKDADYFTIGSDFLESRTDIIMIDTFSVDLSTVLIDSLPISSVDTLLIGNCNDDIFGRISCNSFFEFGLAPATDILDGDIYDSVILSMQYTGYSYGDTLQLMPVSVHLLSEKIILGESGYLYNTSEFAYQETALAQSFLKTRPSGPDSSIGISLSDAFGQELFDRMHNNDDLMESESEFITHYKGLAIVSDTTVSSSIVSFKSSDGDISIKVYTHRIGEQLEQVVYEFPLVNSQKQFTSIKHDYANTPLESVSSQQQAIPSFRIENRAYVQGGVGLMAKLQFPSMNEFLLFENCYILKAELYLRPVAGSYNNMTLPVNVYLYHTNKNNGIGSVLSTGDGSVLTSVFSFDEYYHDQTYYLFDITNFLKNELSDSYFDTEHGLLVSFSDHNYLCSFDRIILDDESNKPQLKIYYVKY